MGFTWVFLLPKSSSLQRKITHLQLSIPLWLTSIWPTRSLWVGWLVLSLLLLSRIFMLAGKWRFIVDLSSPGRASVNNGIDPDEFTLHYLALLGILGIELDSFNQVAPLPQEKLLALKNLISSWLPRKWCNRHELESLIGHLHHAAKVVWPRRTFLHRMIGLLCCFRGRDHPICLNREFHLNLLWWHQFLEDWHGVSFWLFPGLLPEADVEVSSDAAGKFGYGAYMKGHWFAGPWVPPQQLQSIAYKELFPIVLAAHVWGHLWVKKHNLFRSDNETVVHILNT